MEEKEILGGLASLGTAIPEALLPAPGVDLRKWAVIACDQFTQERAYWQRVAAETGGAPSALNLILPEVFLNDGDSEARIKAIHAAMASYMKDLTVLRKGKKAAVYVERTLSDGNTTRQGLLLALDLERYNPGSGGGLIRATEEIVPERLPARAAVRKGAALDVPHVIALIDDEEDVLMTLASRLLRIAPDAYSTSLMFGSGSVRGRLLCRKNDWSFILCALERLARRSQTRYGLDEPFLFAVGDGNHSLAAAKYAWEEYKAASGTPDSSHPGRWALVEVENLWSPAVTFEPIHRLVCGASGEAVKAALAGLPAYSARPVSDRAALAREVAEKAAGRARYGLVSGGEYTLIECGASSFAASALQPLLDKAASQHSWQLDYIHGEASLFSLASTEGRAGILLPPVDKRSLFDTVAKTGPLPRKSFSMGEAQDKRFYLESRALFN